MWCPSCLKFAQNFSCVSLGSSWSVRCGVFGECGLVPSNLVGGGAKDVKVFRLLIEDECSR